MVKPWPYRRDRSEVDKLKRIIDSYRTRLAEVDPAGCRIIDARMALFGEPWVGGPIDTSEELTVEEIYAKFGRGFEPHCIHSWAHDEPSKLPKRGNRNGKTLYRLGDVLAYQIAI